MPSDLEFTGERFLPGVVGEIAHEHWHRYAFARRFAAGRRVADVACGEGYGAALLAGVAAEVVGVDIDPVTIAHAARAHAVPNLRFAAGSATALPLADASVDAVVSFETIEHLPADAQPRMLREFARVLHPGGVLVLSSPNRPQYSEARGYRNPFHLHELDRDELAVLLDADFPVRRWHRQRRYFGSAVWAEEEGGAYEALSGDERKVSAALPPDALYFIVIAARSTAALPAPGPPLSLYTDSGEHEWQRIEEQAGEVLRLDGLLKARDASLAQQAAHVAHLEELCACRDGIVEARDAELAQLRKELWASATELGSVRQRADALDAERARLEGAITAQERIISYRQSARWWLQLPWLRVRNLWQRLATR